MKHLVSIFFLLFIHSCTEITDVELPDQKKVIVSHTFFTENQNWGIHVGRTTQTLNNINPFDVAHLDLDNATVEIILDNQVVSTLLYIGGGNYRSPGHRPEAGEKYTVRISAPEIETVHATDHLPNRVNIDTLIISREQAFSTYTEFDLDITFTDNASEANFYRFDLTGTPLADASRTDLIWFESSDPALTENDVFDREGFGGAVAYMTDSFFEGKQNTVRITFRLFEFYTDIFVNFASVTEAYYRYGKTSDVAEDIQNNPFSEPFNVYTNFDKGTGIFAGYILSRRSIFNP